MSDYHTDRYADPDLKNLPVRADIFPMSLPADRLLSDRTKRPDKVISDNLLLHNFYCLQPVR
ncbi:hypothetical protein D3C85_1661720 [compost metagenome]